MLVPTIQRLVIPIYLSFKTLYCDMREAVDTVYFNIKWLLILELRQSVPWPRICMCKVAVYTSHNGVLV